jgi:predicted acyltransferase
MMTQPRIHSERLPSIDAFRGLAVLLMAAANFMGGINWIPACLKHAPDVGYTVIDVIAPMFIVAIGFTTGLSARRRRERLGTAAALGGMAVRFLAILGVGAVLTAGQALCLPGGERLPDWGVLQAIGAAGLLTLTVIYTKPWVRAVIGLALLASYQFLLDSFFLQTVLSSSHNGIIGSLSWGGLLMLATAAADTFFAVETPVKRKGVLLLSGIAAFISGIVLSWWFPIAKNRASISYMLVSLGLCLLVFLLFHALLDGKAARAKWLCAVGKNPLAMYLAHLLILGLFTLPGVPYWYEQAPIWLACAQGGVLLGLLVMLGKWMESKKLILKP